MSKIKTLTCPGPPEHSFEFEQKGRGRPPRFCAEHKPQPSAKKLTEGLELNTRQIAEEQALVDSDETNPFIKKAKSSNPFIAKAEARGEQIDVIEHWVEKGKEITDAQPKPSKNRPARFERPHFDEEIVDSETYNDAGLPGVKIHDIRRDTAGQWSSRLTINGETFDLIRRGGWQIVYDGGTREALPHVAAAIQARVNRLEPKAEDDDPKKRKKPAKTLEDVADEVAPVESTAVEESFEPESDKEPEFEGAVCECCERVQEKGEIGWAIIEGIQFCPTCTTALEDDDESEPDDSDSVISDFSGVIEAEIG